jgi:hypothetical protein
MTRKPLLAVLIVAFVWVAAGPVRAEVKKEEKTLVTFSGMLGRVANIFGGKAAREGVVSTVAVSGNRKMTANENTAQIVDLGEEKVYDLDLRRKTYTVTTFAEIRRRLAEAEAKARESRKSEPKEEQAPTEGKELEVDLDVKDTGQTKTINGFDTRQVIVTVTVREKGRKLEEGGGLVLTADNWLTRSVPALKEILDFDMRYYKAIAGPMLAVNAQQMATVFAMMPGLKDAFSRMNREALDGTAISTTLTVDSVKSPEQMKQQASQGGDSSVPTSVGGAIGGLMRRRAQKQAESTSPRSTFMTSNSEVLKIATSVSAGDVAIPADFKQRN